MNKIIVKFLESNEARWRLARTIIQGIIGVIIANADFLIEHWKFTPETKAFIVALVMAILSPIMAELGTRAATEEAADVTDYLTDEAAGEGEEDGN